MSKIVFFCIPAHGHTNPTIGVVKELVKRGHDVYYYSFDEFKEKLGVVGANYISCDGYELDIEQSADKSADKVGKDMVFSTKLIVKAVLAMDEPVTKQISEMKPDVIVGDSVAYWGKLIAMKLGIPFVSSTTTFAFNRYSSSIMKTSFFDTIKMIAAIPKTKKLLEPLRKKGYPAETILDIVQNDNDTTTVVYTSKEFQPFADTFSDKYHFIGPSIREAYGEFEKTADKLVYISLGTVNNLKADFFTSCIKAFKGSDYQIVISAGKSFDIASLGVLPENIAVYSYIDQMAVLKKADVFISHCGMNSANESLYFGVPLVTYPQTPEQGGVARQLETMGAGLPLKKNNPSQIKKAVENVLDDSSFKTNAKKISDSFKKCGGVSEAADTILSMAGKKQ